MLLFLVSVMFRGAANDMKKEKDRNYIVDLFAGVVSFVALIVSLVAKHGGEKSFRMLYVLTRLLLLVTAAMLVLLGISTLLAWPTPMFPWPTPCMRRPRLPARAP